MTQSQCVWQLFVLPAVLIVSAVGIPFYFTAGLDTISYTADELADLQHLDSLAILSSDNQLYAKWERKETIAFSLNQIKNAVTYLFVGAGALLAFGIKQIIETPPANGRWPAFFMVQSMALCLASFVDGMMAHLYFAELATQTAFTIYAELGWWLFFQAVVFGLAAMCAAVAAILIIYNQVKAP